MACLGYLGNVSLVQGNEEQATSLYNDSLHQYYKNLPQADTIAHWDQVQVSTATYEQIINRIPQELERLKTILKSDVSTANRYYLGYVTLQRPKIVESYLNQPRHILQGNLEFLLYVMVFFAGIAVVEGQLQRALQLYVAAEQLRATHKVALMSLINVHRHVVVRDTGTIYRYLGAEVVDSVVAESTQMTWEQILATVIDR